jgi:hypothetical protein
MKFKKPIFELPKCTFDDKTISFKSPRKSFILPSITANNFDISFGDIHSLMRIDFNYQNILRLLDSNKPTNRYLYLLYLGIAHDNDRDINYRSKRKYAQR